MTKLPLWRDVDLYCSRMHGADDGKTIRIEAKVGRHRLACIEIGLEEFAELVTGKVVKATAIASDVPGD